MNARLNIIIILLIALIGSLGAYAYWNRPPTIIRETMPIVIMPTELKGMSVPGKP